MIVNYKRRVPFIAFPTKQPKDDLLRLVCDSWIAPEVYDEDFQAATFIKVRRGMFNQIVNGYVVRQDFLRKDGRIARLYKELANPAFSTGQFYKIDQNWEVFECNVLQAEEHYRGYCMATNMLTDGLHIKRTASPLYYRVGGGSQGVQP